jgi:outer membrane protein OmpA-like peptidoglycan-associated protein
MKKSILALACGAMLGQSMVAQSAQEVTYKEDPSQGYLLNGFKDNWFVTAEGGVNILFSPNDVHRNWLDRWAPAASVYFGKWFSPVIGARIGVSWMKIKGLSETSTALGVIQDEPTVDGLYRQKFQHVGPVADIMFNLSNLVCGYKPGRFYNLTLYAGCGGYFTYTRQYDSDGSSSYEYTKDKVLAIRAGLINTFQVSKQVQISLDLRFTATDNHLDEAEYGWNKTAYDAAAFLGVTYLFPKRDWSAPVVPVCPEPENCDALRARLQAADARIADLEQQLKDCLNRPKEVAAEPAKAPLATIYYPINVSKLTSEDVRVVNAVAEVMKSQPDNKYVVTGWADNYTGNDQINNALRQKRAAGVEKQLLKAGVDASQFTTTTNTGNLLDLGEKFVSLDRATTIQEAE